MLSCALFLDYPGTSFIAPDKLRFFFINPEILIFFLLLYIFIFYRKICCRYLLKTCFFMDK